MLRLFKVIIIKNKKKYVKKKFILSDIIREWYLINQRQNNQDNYPENVKQLSLQLSKPMTTPSTTDVSLHFSATWN